MSRLAVIAAQLVVRWSALPALADVDVRRGAPIGGLPAGAYLVVEFDGTPESTADSRFETVWSDLAGTSIEERGEIICSSVAQTGDSDLAATEAQAVAQMNACIADLATDRTVNGQCHAAMVTAGTATQLQNSQGVAVVVPFVVSYFATYAAA